MKKGFKKIVATVLTASMAMSVTVPAFAENNITHNDIYAQHFSETVTIEDENYIFQYEYDENGNRQITITNEENNATDILVADEKTATIYLNDEALLTSSTEANQNGLEITASGGWQDIGTETFTFTIDHATNINAVAAGVAALLAAFTQPFGYYVVGAAAVINAMGVVVLQSFVNKHVDCPVTATFSQYVSFGQIQYRLSWTFLYEGKTLGPYSVYFANPTTYSIPSEI